MRALRVGAVRWGRWLLVAAMVLGMLLGQWRTASGAITSTAPVGGGYINITSLSWSQAVATGNNRLMLVRLAHVNSNVTVTSVSYGGTALTQLSTTTNGSGATALRVTIFYLLAPTVGTANVVVNFSASVRAVGASTVHTGVSQTAPFGSVATANGTSATPSVTVSGAVNDRIVDIVASQGTGGTVQGLGSGQTNGAFGTTGSTTSDVLGMASEKPGATSTTLSWTQTSSVPWLSMGVALKAYTATVSGTVYEDANYGGGAGRSLAASSGSGLAGATVELYDSTGNYVASTTTAVGGGYSFSGVTADSTSYVRVVSGSVRSARSGSSAAAVGVLTYRTQFNGSTASGVADHVGGVNPALADPGNAGFGARLSTSTNVYSAGLTGTAQALTPVTVVQANVSGIDFGFNFNTVVNTADSGPGSLRQAITNANTLGNDNLLAQSGRTAGVEHLVFMIPNGSTGAGGSLGLAAGGMRSTLNAFVGGVASIAPTSALPDVSTVMRIDARTQPGWTAAPVVELNGSTAGTTANGLTLRAGSSTVAGFVINRFGATGIEAVDIGGHTIAGNYIGLGTDGSTAQPNVNGLNLYNVANTVVGGTTAADRNVVSGNSNVGVVITGTTSTGIVLRGNYIGTTAAGTGALGNGSLGVYLNSPGNTIGGTAGNVVSGNTYQGILLDAGASGTTVQGNLIGLDSNGAQALPNGSNGVYVASAGNTIGGTVAGAGNTMSGNTGAGVRVTGSGATGNVLKGNIIGLNAAGDTARPNTQAGVLVDSGSATLGGLTASDRNVISGNGQDGINVTGGTVTVQGNYIGANKAGTAALGNGGDGVELAVSGSTIGGTANGAGNLIRGNGGRGVSIASGARTGNAVLGNAIYGNTNIGIDLGADGITANDGVKNSALPNSSMDTPVITAATLVGTTLTVSGYVGSAAGQAAFQGARVEFFQSDASSANGSGQAYLGFLTADSSGNFSGTLTVSGLTANNSLITATATDAANNTSEFGPNALAVSCTLSGTVFEDLNYGGGAGRSLAASGGAGVTGATVELYNASGVYVSNTTTVAGGSYSFPNLAAGSYFVRAVSGTVGSTRSGSNAALRGVLTWRTTAASGTPVAVSDFVGGTDPTQVDATTGGSGTAFNTGTNVFSVGRTGTLQAVTPATVASGTLAGLDFGFNFSTVVNTNDSGQGSLRQFITNASALGGQANLAQSGNRRTATDGLEPLPAGRETSIFMISSGSAVPGLRAALPSQLSGGVAAITLASVLPYATQSNVHLDATTQSANVGNTNAGFLGSGGTVGADALAFAQVPRPEVQLTGPGGTYGFTLGGSNQAVRGFALTRFYHDVFVYNAGTGTLVELNYLGTPATSFTDPGSATRSGYGMYWDAHDNGTVRNNLVGFHSYYGLFFVTADNMTISGNEIVASGLIDGAYDGLSTYPSSGSTISGNLVRDNAGNGIDLFSLSSSNTVVNNTLSGNGMRAQEYNGLRIYGDSNTVDRNLITGNYRSGINVYLGKFNRLTRNQIYGNGGVVASITGTAATTGLGIDLANNETVAVNNGTKNTGLPNYEMDHPVFTAASLSGTTLTVAGYIGNAPNLAAFASAVVEVFISSDDGSGYGEGQTYLGSVTADANGNFSGSVSMAGVTATSGKVTGTATDTTGNTSEFGPNFNYGVTISGTVFEDVNYGGGGGRTLAASGGAGVTGATVELYNASGAYVRSTSTVGGAYAFNFVSPGAYFVRVVSAGLLSTRSGATSAQVGVLTYRTNAASGTAVAVTDFVGGTNPAVADAAAAGNGAAFNTSSFVFSAGPSGTAQNVTAVTVTGSAVIGLDFGFNFDTVVNTNDSGQGSLRQAITNANALGGEAGMNQAGRSLPGVESLIFMISNGATANGDTATGGKFALSGGLRSTNNAFSSGVASLTLTSSLPAITSAVVIDAQAQPGWSSTTRTPIVELNGNSAAVNAFNVQAASVALRGFVINRCTGDGVVANASATGFTLQGSFIGLNAAGTAASGNAGAGLTLTGTPSAVIGGTSGAATRNVIAGNGGSGIVATGATVTGTVIRGNYIGTNAAGNAGFSLTYNTQYGVTLLSSATGVTVGGAVAGAGNVISGNQADGVSVAAGSHTIQGNLIGLDATGSFAVRNAAVGISVFSTAGAQQIGGIGTLARNVISGNKLEGIYFNGGGNGSLVQGNYIGTDINGTAAVGNGRGGGVMLHFGATGVTIGGTASGAGNLISGNSAADRGGISVAGGTHTIQGNTIGLSVTGAVLPNGAAGSATGGIILSGSGTALIGGTSSDARNVISGNGGAGIYITGGSATIQGNYIGVKADGSTAAGNAGHGISVTGISATTVVGGTATGAGNVIANNTGKGITYASGTSALTVSRNSIFANTVLGIDLGNDGITANDGATTTGQPNLLMDQPVVVSASLSGTTLTVTGYVGSAANQASFGSARVELFISEGLQANGQGQTYLGFMTADANGNFSGTISNVSGVTPGSTRITGTATDGSGNTSEFGPNAVVGYAVAGTVFEDVNYGGGAGRSQGSSAGTGVSGTRVELYDGNAAFVAATTTAANGSYAFGGLAGGRAYFVRVVNSTVLSTRSGSSASLVPVMTYRTEAGNSSATAVTNEVGGTKPAAVDAAAGTTGTSLWTQCAAEGGTCSFTGTRTVRYGANNATTGGWVTRVLTGGTACTNGVFGDPLSGTVKACYLLNADHQSVTTVFLGSANVAGIDFGFSFSTVVNTNDSGAGSLRQAITNANTLGGDAALAQAGRTAGIENLVFMISNGSSAAGLRSTNNDFASAAATVTLASALPQVTAPLVMDAQTQPGWSAAPVLALRGEGAGTAAHGLSIGSAALGSVVRGWSVGGFGLAGVYIAANNVTVEGVYAGLAPDGSTVRANATANASMAGVYLASGTGVVVGGTGATQRNVLSGNSGAGFWAAGGSATLYGNYIGTDAAGSTAKGNTSWGVVLNSAGPHRVGGAVTGQGNVISGQTVVNAGGIIIVSGTGHVVQGNTIGLNATRSAAIPNGVATSNFSAGIDVRSGSGFLIGGTNAGEGNVIASNQSMGVRVTAQATRILGNSIYGNANRGIDLNADGVTVNDGATNASQPNNGMDQPVFTSAAVASGNLNVTGYVGSAAGQSAFSGARVEVFVSDGDASGYGQGQTYVGFLTADSSGNFSGSLPVPGGVTITNGSSRLTGTATDTGNNTSEFGPNFLIGLTVSGRVYEDANYGGGAGRDFASAAGTGAAGATVQLYTGAGTLAATATTATDGSYNFSGLTSGGYLVRVVQNTVRSARSGSTASLLPVQTWRYEASWNTPGAVTNEVGGARPEVADSASTATLSWANCASENNGSSNPCAFTGTRVVRFGAGANWTLRTATAGVACSTAVFGDPAVGVAKTCEVLTPNLHSAASVQVAASAVSGIDFGFNFSTVVNTNDSGAGSLRQAITNANTLGGDNLLAQSGRTAGIENLVFMISNGSSAAGLRSSNNFFATSAGSYNVATITPSTGLPAFSTVMVVDAQTQPGWAANPIIELNGASSGASTGLSLSGGGSTVRGLVINRFGQRGIDLAATGNTVQGCWLGLNAAGTAAAANGSWGLHVSAGGSNLIGGTTPMQRNVISGNNDIGIYVAAGSSNTIYGNYVGTNAAGTAAVANVNAGVYMHAATGSNLVGGAAAGQGNVISGNGYGVVSRGGSGNNTIRGNLIGRDAGNANTLGNTAAGVFIDSSSNNNRIGGSGTGDGNVVAGSGSGGAVTAGIRLSGAASTGNSMLGNSIYASAGIGIDLGTAAGVADGVTANDGAKTTGQPNLWMDSPVFTSATASGSTLTVAGYVGSAAGQTAFAGSRVEVFVADNDASGFGEGQTYIGFLTADASGNFSGILTVPGGVTVTNGSTRLTGTATDTGNNTSEFGANITVGLSMAGTVFEDLNYGGGAGRATAGAPGWAPAANGASRATVELYDGSGNFLATTQAGADGSYSFSGRAPGSYQVRLVTGSAPSSRSGWASTLLPVLTYRVNASTGSAVGVTDVVGGATPNLPDAPANSGSQTLAALTTGSAVPQAVAPVTLGSAGVTLVDFGISFDVVTNTTDSGAGSLRQAITNANALGGDASLAQAGRTAAVENVVFMISNGSSAAGLRSSNNFFSGGVATVSPASALPTVSDTLTLDAQTQPGWVSPNPIVQISGAGAGSVDGLTLDAPGCVVRGFIVGGFGGSGLNVTGNASGSAVQGNWLGLAASGTAANANSQRGLAVGAVNGLIIGGSTTAQRNVISGNTQEGVLLNGSANVFVTGNYIGTNAAGTAAVGNGGNGGMYLIGGATATTIGGTSTTARNVISGNAGRALTIESGVQTVRGNYIGINAAGTAALGNTGGSAIYLTGTAGAQTIGGTSANARNVIVSSVFHGVNIATASAAGTTVQGNYIGTDATGSTVLASGTGGLGGVFINGAGTGIFVGGTAAGAGNLIRGFGTGVIVASGSGNAILGNSIYGNTNLGIDIGGDGVTANDGAKTNGQPNLRIDHPVFTSARARGNQLTVAGYVGSAAGQAAFAGSRVEIFLSDNDATGFGEGRTYLGALTTDGSGGFSGTVTMPAAALPLGALPLGAQLTGTATDGSSNTSEFGANFAGLLVDLVVNSNLDEADTTPGDGYCLTASGVCTLRAALAERNAQASLPATLIVAFALPGCSATGAAGCTIAPTTALPSITRAVLIDGITQAGTRSVASACAPLVELDGSGAPAGTSGLIVAAAGTTVRGLSIGGFGQSGISISSGNTGISCNHIGLRADGSTVRANGSVGSISGGVYVNSGSGIVIGGNTAAQRNVLSGNGGSGVWVAGGTATISGNYIGTDATGNSAAGNGRWGVTLGAAGQTVGGSASGAGNLISGNVANTTGGVLVFAAGQVIQGNRIGTNASGTGFIPNGNAASTYASGIDVRVGDGQTIGGTNTGEANVVAGNQGHGIRVATQAVRISGNSIYGNLWQGIDLNADGVTANDGATNASAPNNGMDFPVINGAGINTTATGMTVSGYVGTGSGQAVFAGARVEFFKAAADASGFGEGQTYLGFLVADGNGRFSGSIAFASGLVAVGDAITATATDAAGNTSEFGPNWTSTTVAALTPAGFNAFDTDAASSALSGVIRSRTAGSASTFAVIALDSNGSALHAGFTGSVSLRWLDARNDSGAATGTCRASWVDLGSAGTASFSNNARVTVSLTPPATGTRSMRLQMSYAGPSGTVTACSNDAFAALPASLAWVNASDADAATPGTVRTLNNTAASGGVVHRAGRPFTLRAQALDATGALMTGYDGAPALAVTGCVLPSGCSAGTLTAAATAAVAGVYTHSNVSYAEVGAITVALTDADYGSIDASDTAAAARTVASGNLPVGRFVPDAFTASISSNGLLATANGACLASGSGATFLGQGFGWATAPQVTLTARNAAGSTTTLWAGALMKITTGSGLGASLAASGTGAATVAASFGGFGVADLGNGQVRVTASSTDRFVLDLAAGGAQATVTPNWVWALAVNDASEAGVSGNPTLLANATQTGIGFDRGALFHSGRLALAPGYGDARAGVRLVAQLQRYTAAGWVTMTEDEGCVTVQPQNLGVAAPSGVFASAGLCAAPMAAAATTRGGRAWLTLPATPGAAPGRLQMQLAGDAASGSACTSAGALQAVAPLGLPWLLGGPAATGPQALGTWGSTQRDTVLRRETW